MIIVQIIAVVILHELLHVLGCIVTKINYKIVILPPKVIYENDNPLPNIIISGLPLPFHLILAIVLQDYFIGLINLIMLVNLFPFTADGRILWENVILYFKSINK